MVKWFRFLLDDFGCLASGLDGDSFMIAVFKLEGASIFLLHSLLNVEFANFDGIKLVIFVMSVKVINFV